MNSGEKTAFGPALRDAQTLAEGAVGGAVASLPSSVPPAVAQLELALNRGPSTASTPASGNQSRGNPANAARLKNVPATSDVGGPTEVVGQSGNTPGVLQAPPIVAGLMADFGINDVCQGCHAVQKGNVVDALKHFCRGGLNLAGELTGLKDLFVRFPEAVSRGDFWGAALSLASPLLAIATFGAGSLVTATARTALKSFLQTGAREAFEVFAKETAEQIGKYLATDAAKKLGKDSLQEVVLEGFEAAGKEAAEGVAKEVAKVGAEKVSAETVKQLASEATEKATKKLLEDLGVDELITDLVERRLNSIANNKGLSGAGKNLADDLRSLGVDENKINQMVRGVRTQFKSAGKAGVYGEKFDEELIQIYTEAITKEVKEQLLGAGAKEGFSQGFDRTLTQQLRTAGTSVDDATRATWKKAAGEGFDEGLEKGVRETVERAVREGFDRFRRRGDQDDAPANGIRPTGRHIWPSLPDPSVRPLDIEGGSDLQLGGVGSSEAYFAYDGKLAELLGQDAERRATATSAEHNSRRCDRAAGTPASTASTPTALSPNPAAVTAPTSGSGSTDIG